MDLIKLDFTVWVFEVTADIVSDLFSFIRDVFGSAKGLTFSA